MNLPSGGLSGGWRGLVLGPSCAVHKALQSHMLTRAHRHAHAHPRGPGGGGPAWRAGGGHEWADTPTSGLPYAPQGHGASQAWTPAQSVYFVLRAEGGSAGRGDGLRRGGSCVNLQQGLGGEGASLTGEPEPRTDGRTDREPGQSWAGGKTHESWRLPGRGEDGGRGRTGLGEGKASQGLRDVPSRVPPCPHPGPQTQ